MKETGPKGKKMAKATFNLKATSLKVFSSKMSSKALEYNFSRMEIDILALMRMESSKGKDSTFGLTDRFI